MLKMTKTCLLLIIAVLAVFTVVFFHESLYLRLVLHYQQQQNDRNAHHKLLIDQIALGEQILRQQQSLIDQLKTKNFSDPIIQSSDAKPVSKSDSSQTSSKVKPQQGPSLYVFGGLGGNGFDSTFLSITNASRLNNTSGEWESIKSLPSERNHYCGAVVNNSIYLFGGTERRVIFSPAPIVYDTLTDTYTSLPDMPEPRHSCGAAALNGYIYVAGGSYYNDNYHVDPNPSVIRFHIQTQQWSTVSSMNKPRMRFQLVELNGRLYTIGGKGSVESYDPSVDRWSAVADPEFTRIFTGAAVHKGKIYSNELAFGFEVYSPDTDKWTRLMGPNETDLYSPHIGDNALVSMNGKLWMLGGRVSKGYSYEIVKTVYTYDDSTAEWTKQKDMDVARQHHQAFVVHP